MASPTASWQLRHVRFEGVCPGAALSQECYFSLTFPFHSRNGQDKKWDISCHFRIISCNFRVIKKFISDQIGEVHLHSLQRVLSLQMWPCIIKYIWNIKRIGIKADSRILHIMSDWNKMKLNYAKQSSIMEDKRFTKIPSIWSYSLTLAFHRRTFLPCAMWQF